MLWQAGTAVTQSQTTGLIYSGGGLGVATAGTSGTSRSALAINAAPPQPKQQDNSAGCVGLIIGSFAGLFLWIATASAVGGDDGMVLGMIVGAATAIGIIGMSFRSNPEIDQWNQQEYPRLRALWEATFQCMRCGQRFVPPGTSAPATRA